MDIRPTLGGKNLLHDFSLSNRKWLTGNNVGRFFKEIVKQISLKNIGRMSILRNSSHLAQNARSNSKGFCLPCFSLGVKGHEWAKAFIERGTCLLGVTGAKCMQLREASGFKGWDSLRLWPVLTRLGGIG